MNEFLISVVVVINTIALVLSGIVTHLAYRAYRRKRTRNLATLCVGFLLITLSLAVGGGLHQVLGRNVLVSVLVRDGLVTLGLASLVYSLYHSA